MSMARSGVIAVLSAARPSGCAVSRAEVESSTRVAVAGMLAEVGARDAAGWMSDTIATALLLATDRVRRWQGRPQPWAGEIPPPTAQDPRVEYQRICAVTDGGTAVVSGYQDDGGFGLAPRWFTAGAADMPPRMPEDIVIDGLVTGDVRRVDVAWDLSVEHVSGAGLLSEILIHGHDATTLLVAAEYVDDRWRNYDESVVPLPDLETADRLDWFVSRPTWRTPS